MFPHGSADVAFLRLALFPAAGDLARCGVARHGRHDDLVVQPRAGEVGELDLGPVAFDLDAGQRHPQARNEPEQFGHVEVAGCECFGFPSSTAAPAATAASTGVGAVERDDRLHAIVDELVGCVDPWRGLENCESRAATCASIGTRACALRGRERGLVREIARGAIHVRQVHGAPATEGVLEPDVVRAQHARRQDHGRAHGHDAPVLAAGQHGFDRVRGRVEEPVEGLEGDFARAVRGGREGAGFARVGRDGFLDQDVLAGLERREGPFVMQAVGEGDVDCVDVRVGDYLVVGPVCLYGAGEAGFVVSDLGFGPRLVSCRDGGDESRRVC